VQTFETFVALDIVDSLECGLAVSLTGGNLPQIGETLLNALGILEQSAGKSQSRRNDRAYWPGVWP
jgi:hypothetical protein